MSVAQVDHVYVHVEEPSMEAALRALLPKMLGDVSFQISNHRCKSELLAKLPARLRGYARFLPPTARVLVVIDREDDCVALKQRLDAWAREAGLTVRGDDGQPTCQVVNRIAIEELEAWYFGDWDAVRAVYPKVPATVPNKVAYRNPDAIKGGTWEAFLRVLQQAGYCAVGLPKIEAAGQIARGMDPARNRSRSFQKLREVCEEFRATVTS
ncbi:MAG: DUF4276 family protein [Kofleriaceae bacterium]